MNANESPRPISPLPESHDQDTVSELQQYLNEATLVYQDATTVLTTLRAQPDPATELEDVKCSETLAELRRLVGDVRRLRPSQDASFVRNEAEELVSGAVDASTRADLDNRAIEAAVGEENKRLLILQRVLGDRDRFFGDRARTIIYSEDDLIPLTTEDAIFDHKSLMDGIIEALGADETVSADVQTTVCTTYRISAGTCQMIVNNRALYAEAAIGRIVAARELAQAESGRAGVQLDNRIVDRAMQDIEGKIQSYRTQAREVLTTKREGVQNTLRKRISSEVATSATGIEVDEFYAYGNRSIEETTESLLAGEVQDEIRESQESHARDLAMQGLVDVPRIVRKYQMGVDAPRILGGAVRLLEGRVTSLHERFERNRQEAIAEMRVVISVLTDVDLDDVSVERATQALNDPDEIIAINSTVARAAGNIAGQRSLRHPFGSGQSLNEQHIAQLKLLNTHIDRCGAWGNKLQAAIREYDARLDALGSEVSAATPPPPLVPAPAIPSAPNRAGAGALLTTPVPVATETSPGVSDTTAPSVPLRSPVAPSLPQPPLETPSPGDGLPPDGGNGSAAPGAAIEVRRGELLASHTFHYDRSRNWNMRYYNPSIKLKDQGDVVFGDFGVWAASNETYIAIYLSDNSSAVYKGTKRRLWAEGNEVERASFGDEPSMKMKVGSEFDLVGETLVMHVKVTECTYSPDDNTKFQTFTIRAEVHKKPESATGTSTPPRAAALPTGARPAATPDQAVGRGVEVAPTIAPPNVEELVSQHNWQALVDLATNSATNESVAVQSVKALIDNNQRDYVENVVDEVSTPEPVRQAAIEALIGIEDWNFFSILTSQEKNGEPLAIQALEILIDNGQYAWVEYVSREAAFPAVKQKAEEVIVAELRKIVDAKGWSSLTVLTTMEEVSNPSLAMRALTLLIKHGQYDQVTEVSLHAFDRTVKQSAVWTLRAIAEAQQQKIDAALASLPPEIRDAVRGPITDLHAMAVRVHQRGEQIAESILRQTANIDAPVIGSALRAYARELSGIVHATDGNLDITPETLRRAGAEMVTAALLDIQAGADLLAFLGIGSWGELAAGGISQITGETLTRTITQRVIAHGGLDQNIKALLEALLKDPDAVQEIGADSRIVKRTKELVEPADAKAAQAKAERGAQPMSAILSSDTLRGIPSDKQFISQWTIQEVAGYDASDEGARAIMAKLNQKSNNYVEPYIKAITLAKEYYEKGHTS